MYTKIIIFFIVQCAVDCTFGQRGEHFFRKDYKYYEDTESFYKLHTTGRTWQEAKRFCANENAKLLVIEDQKEADVVSSYLKEVQMANQVFVGISDLVAEGVFETIDGRSILDVYHKWRPNQPDNSRDAEDCVEMFSDLKFNDRRCNGPLPFVCKKSLDTLRWNQDCNMSFFDYTYNTSLGRCYKFHSTPMNWTDAHALCAAEQSYLAVINSQDEASYLVELAAKNKIPQSGEYDKINIFLGFHDQFDEGWTTVKGTTLKDSGYDSWSPSQPDLPVEKCGSMFYNGLLNNVRCFSKAFFICEHEIDKLAASLDARFGESTM